LLIDWKYMENLNSIELEELRASLAPVWPDDGLGAAIAEYVHRENLCVVALDDDPTGTQTMHDIWVVTDWRFESFRDALADNEASMYILTNSRSLPLAEAQALNRQIAKELVRAARAVNRKLIIVSRSDSTLRGHYPGEVDALAEGLLDAGLPPFDGICLVPCFFEGGRYTANDIHYVLEGTRLIPAAQTPYASDAVFGYAHSYLPDWVEEKTRGRVKAGQVTSISLEMIRRGGPDAVAEHLQTVHQGVVVVNAMEYRDLQVFAVGLHQAQSNGKHFLFRSAAAIVKTTAGITDRPLLTREDMVASHSKHGGLIVFGSHVPKSNAQLEILLNLPNIFAYELHVQKILVETLRSETIQKAIGQVNTAIEQGLDAVLYTSRHVLTGVDPAASLSISQKVSAALVEITQSICAQPSFLIAKGGITSSDIATKGLGVQRARVLGQIIPGVPVWKLGAESRYPGMSYVIFPGNVGGSESVAEVVKLLR
jgi:uncharacterized protein YgbK (DUF1537 family)